jgi:hypothetical protein
LTGADSTADAFQLGSDSAVALIPPSYLDAVAALEVPELPEGEEGDGEGEVGWRAVATGTIIGFKVGEESGTSHWNLFLVTNRHVISGQTSLHARINQGDRSARFPISMKDADGNPLFLESPDYDVAVTGLDASVLEAAGVEYGWLPDDSLLDLAGLENEGVTGGDGVFVLGFPMGLAGKERMYVGS